MAREVGAAAAATPPPASSRAQSTSAPVPTALQRQPRVAFAALLRAAKGGPGSARSVGATQRAARDVAPRSPSPIAQNQNGGPHPTVARPTPEDSRRGIDDDMIDPIHRQRAFLAPPSSLGAASPPPPSLLAPMTPWAAPAGVESRARASLEEIVHALVRRIAWSGDGRRGTVRIELGAGALSGGTLLIHAEDGRVRVHLDAPPGADAEAWRHRITARLAARNIDVDRVEVT